MPKLPAEIETFIAELDAAIEAHMNWTRRIIRCAVLHSTPGEDVLGPLAHTRCRFGIWFMENQTRFEALDAPATQRVEAVHQAMHDAIRSICTQILAGQPGDTADLDRFEQSQSELISLLASFKTLILSEAVRYDPLTELPLHYAIENDFVLWQKEAKRNRTLLYVVMIDVDHFKPINDTYGHHVGDMVLRALANILKHALRSNESLYRFGGETFLWLLKCTSAKAARQSARRILATIATTPVPLPEGASLTLTVTLGMAQAGEPEDFSSAIKRADLALSEGKQNGGNCYVIAQP